MNSSSCDKACNSCVQIVATANLLKMVVAENNPEYTLQALTLHAAVTAILILKRQQEIDIPSRHARPLIAGSCSETTSGAV